jgi:hypothetical protein
MPIHTGGGHAQADDDYQLNSPNSVSFALRDHGWQVIQE